jgi:RluA family pseudouridine synthase
VGTAAFTNVAGYKFVALSELAPRRDALRALGKRLGLKGTVLLSPEGINVVASGRVRAIEDFTETLRSEPALSDLQIKASPSQRHSFNRWLVKLKPEIIAFGVADIAPAQYTSARVSPATLKDWFDRGERFALLDVRNNYEVEQGTFRGAATIDLDHFRDFPAAARALPAELRDQPLVTFCTGGVRCEKAGPLLESLGFTNVYQLDGGILQYFEDVGGDHYEGGCFVFDKRVAVTPDLQPGGQTLCFACQAVLSADDVASERYREGSSCPHCFEPSGPADAGTLASRAVAVAAASTPLPGSAPYTCRRPITVRARADGLTVVEFLVTLGDREHVDWAAELRSGRLLRRGEALGADDVVWGGDRLLHEQPDHTEPDVNAAVQWLYEDADLVVVDKPAPLAVHPSGRFNRNTLLYLLKQIYPERLRPAHRLDAATTGVQVVTRTPAAARHLQQQFANSTPDKRYLARVHGVPTTTEFTCDARISGEPIRGVRLITDDGLAARTDFSVVGALGDGTTLLEAIPRTGRTNQIRAHLWHLGLPIVGDPVYQPGDVHAHSAKQTGDETMCLHAHRLGVVHPRTGRRIDFEAPAPPWAVPSA